MVEWLTKEMKKKTEISFNRIANGTNSVYPPSEWYRILKLTIFVSFILLFLKIIFIEELSCCIIIFSIILKAIPFVSLSLSLLFTQQK